MSRWIAGRGSQQQMEAMTHVHRLAVSLTLPSQDRPWDGTLMPA